MNANASSSQSSPHKQESGLCGKKSPGSYHELSPHEFNDRKGMKVVVLKDAEAGREFKGYLGVVTLNCSQEIEALLGSWPANQAIGLVCPDGDCSSRLAIRLSRQGYNVFHLSGGLREWRSCNWCDPVLLQA